VYDDLYQWLGTKEGEKDIFRLARIRERKTRDINQIKCIKDGTDQLLVRDERPRTDGRNTLIGCLMGRMRILLLSWMALLMTPTDVL
jgi:hypothetical protein